MDAVSLLNPTSSDFVQLCCAHKLTTSSHVGQIGRVTNALKAEHEQESTHQVERRVNIPTTDIYFDLGRWQHTYRGGLFSRAIELRENVWLDISNICSSLLIYQGLGTQSSVFRLLSAL